MVLRILDHYLVNASGGHRSLFPGKHEVFEGGPTAVGWAGWNKCPSLSHIRMWFAYRGGKGTRKRTAIQPPHKATLRAKSQPHRILDFLDGAIEKFYRCGRHWAVADSSRRSQIPAAFSRWIGLRRSKRRHVWATLNLESAPAVAPRVLALACRVRIFLPGCSFPGLNESSCRRFSS